MGSMVATRRLAHQWQLCHCRRITANPTSRPHRVVAVVLHDFLLMDLAAAEQVFGHCGAPDYSFSVAAVEPGRVTSSSGTTLIVDTGLGALRSADTVVTIGVCEPGDDPPALVAALQKASRRGARIAGICAGAFPIAAAGLLDGKTATTHWSDCDAFARRYPKVQLDPDVLYVDNGDVLTSAGVASGIDLCLHIVRRDLGAQRAANIARRTVVPPHRDGGQAQYIERPVPKTLGESGVHAAALEQTRQWALANLERPLTVTELARHANVAPRTFARRFVEETGATPAQWLIAERLRRAQELLEVTSLPIDQVAVQSGFADGAMLRTHMRRHLDTTPTAYRATFSQRKVS